MKRKEAILPTLEFGDLENRSSSTFLFEDFANQRFLIGYCRKEKKTWIFANKLYPVRIRKGKSPGINLQNKDYKNVNFLILHVGKTKNAYTIVPVVDIRSYSKEDLSQLGYPKASHDYLGYTFGEPMIFERLDVQKLLQQINDPYYTPRLFVGQTICNRFIYSVKNKERLELINKLVTSIDILEDNIFSLDEQGVILETLLRDQTKESDSPNKKNHHHIIWATDNYRRRGEGYRVTDEISVAAITKHLGRVIRPRALKSTEEKLRRIKQKAEVFTPSWVCNYQNNLVDEAWFGRKDVFNHESEDHQWAPVMEPIEFPKDKTWQDYISERRIEICCGEAPYLVSRYDTTTGEFISNLYQRVGLLDRKLRIVNEHATTVEEWKLLAQKAIRSIYAFEWQGDSLLIARENILISYIEYYCAFCEQHDFAIEFNTQSLQCVAEWISWNVWQMDGIKYIIPYSDSTQYEPVQTDIFGETQAPKAPQVKSGIKTKITLWSSSGRQRGSKITTFEEIVNKQ